MAKARHVCGWASALLPGLGSTLLHTAAHCCTRSCENRPAFLSANCLQLSKWRGGKSSGGNQMWARATKMCKEIFPSKMIKYKKIVPRSCFKLFVFWGGDYYTVLTERGGNRVWWNDWLNLTWFVDNFTTSITRTSTDTLFSTIWSIELCLDHSLLTVLLFKTSSLEWWHKCDQTGYSVVWFIWVVEVKISSSLVFYIFKYSYLPRYHHGWSFL